MRASFPAAVLVALLAAGAGCAPIAKQSLTTGYAATRETVRERPAPAVSRARRARSSLAIALDGGPVYANTARAIGGMLRVGDSVEAVPSWAVLWETRPLGRMWIDPNGIAHFLAPGPVEVRAKTPTHRAAAKFTIERNPVTSVAAVAEVLGDVYPGDTVRIAAIGRDADERRVPGAQLRYMIASRGAAGLPARIDREGRFVADSAGLYLVLVESNNAVARVPLLVKPAPIIVARVERGDADVADGIARLAPVSVTAAPTSRIRITSPDYEAYVGTTIRLDARIWSEGSDDPDTTATPAWETSHPDGALVDHRGTVMLLKPGIVTITARHGDKVARRRIQVWPSPAVQVVLRSTAHYPRAGDVVRLIDYAWQRGGIPVHHSRANFAITRDGDHTADAWISENKEFVARVPGTYTVLSELNGMASTVTFTVHPAGGRCELRLRKWDPSCAR